MTAGAMFLLALSLAPSTMGAQEMQAGGDTTARSATGDSLRADPPAPPRSLLPWASWVIVPDSIDRSPVTTMSDLLQARVPGLSVQRTSGASGSVSRVRLRGTRSSLTSSAPLVIVDGLRVSVTGPAWATFSVPGPDPGDEWASRLDDLDPEDVERVEVLGGPAAAARFGSGAAAGAIVITTRQGAGDGFHWAAHGSFGTLEQRSSFPANFDQRGVNAFTGEHMDYCGTESQALLHCTALPDSLLHSNALVTDSPFRTGLRSQLGVSGRAGGELGSVYIATDVTRESGAVRMNDVRRRHVLGHGVIHPLRSLSIGARAGYTRGSLSGWRPDDSNIFYSALISGPDDADGYDISPDTIAMMATARGSVRFIFGGTATWEPARWLRITGTLGEDRNALVDDQNPPGFGFGPDVTIWNRTSFYNHFKTARAEASSSWRIGHSLRVTPSIGWERLENKESGNHLVFNSYFSTTDPAASSTYTRHVRIDGLSGHVNMVWRDRVALTGGVRREKSWRVDDQKTYPMVGASWALSAEPWFPSAAFIDELRVRAAYGEAAQPRRSLARNLVFVPVGRGNDPGIVEPSTTETELGVDMEALHHRLALSITHYRGNSDAWVVGYPSFPLTPPPRYPGTIRSSGLEIGLSAEFFEAGPLTAGVDVVAAFPRTRYTGFPYGISSRQSMIPGYPVAGYWAPPILGYTDLNQDHIIGTDGCTPGQFPTQPTCEVTLGEASYLGPSTPTRELSLRPRVAFRRLTLSALFDYRGGHKLFNETDYWRCQGVCRASQDAQASLDDQARAAAAMLGSAAGFIEDADFWKFRELSFAYAVPDAWAAALGAKRLSLALAARNLATWTRYRGPDPEVNTADYESLRSTDSFAQPQVRYLILRLDIGW
ncbi:MAG TPA: TonB-dependent receptor plug domain-containing protein [Gemmatimonadaceae bacterium]